MVYLDPRVYPDPLDHKALLGHKETLDQRAIPDPKEKRVHKAHQVSPILPIFMV
jgi:hypothetical protein